jgi:hypothetical protein
LQALLLIYKQSARPDQKGITAAEFRNSFNDRLHLIDFLCNLSLKNLLPIAAMQYSGNELEAAWPTTSVTICCFGQKE